MKLNPEEILEIISNRIRELEALNNLIVDTKDIAALKRIYNEILAAERAK